MIEQQILIKNKLGLHARAASKFVSLSQRFAADITVRNADHQANGKSIMSMMILQATRGTELQLQADGEDEQDALAQLVDLIDNLFGEAE